MHIRNYTSKDEAGWVRCRVLSFLDTAYFDNVIREKETYNNPVIELVAVEQGQIVGLIDIEYELVERTLCSRGVGLGGMIWHIAVHPDFRRNGIGNLLLCEAEKIAIEKGLNRLEAWTRDDPWVHKWYKKNKFIDVESYLHVYIDGSLEMKDTLTAKVPALHPVQAFSHYNGDNKDNIKAKFKRVHECTCFEKNLIDHI
ncbi:N-acetyltransferase [Bacillus sp. SM2101]|uniref:GNAT family N-acetyltransferase n=1 Tax=Bacillus sp. SM2101 TaxID=2805366 RepID=UPI001BDDD251|nr:N-acetyltransferase [Bacillus sp. SM2101]